MKRVPIKAVADFCKKYKKDQTIVLAWDRASGKTWISTYGVTKADCEQAALGGDRIAKLLGLEMDQIDGVASKPK